MESSSRMETERTPIRRTRTSASKIPQTGGYRARLTRYCTRSMPKRAKSCGRAETRSLRGPTGAALQSPTAAFTLAPMMAFYIASASRNSCRALVLAALLVSGSAMLAQESNPDRIQSLERQLAEQKRTLRDWGGLIRYGSDNSELRPPVAGENRVVFLGDQITDYWGRGKARFFPDKPWLNRGIAGQTTDQMLIRFRQDVISLHPKAVVILGGLNDIAGIHTPSSEQLVLDNLMSMTELAQSNGIRVVVASVTPVCDCFTKSGRKRWQGRIKEVNELIQE